MNKIKFILVFLLALALYSCVDTEERIVINADESGSYTLTIDLGKLIELSNQMMPDSTRSSKPKEKKDSIIYFKNFIIDSSSRCGKIKYSWISYFPIRIPYRICKTWFITLYFLIKNKFYLNK